MTEYYCQKWLKYLRFKGLSIGNRIWYRDCNPPQWLINHERMHVKQYMRLSPLGIMPIGILFYSALYSIEFAVNLIKYRNFYKAYINISFEIEAREAE